MTTCQGHEDGFHTPVGYVADECPVCEALAGWTSALRIAETFRWQAEGLLDRLEVEVRQLQAEAQARRGTIAAMVEKAG